MTADNMRFLAIYGYYGNKVIALRGQMTADFRENGKGEFEWRDR